MPILSVMSVAMAVGLLALGAGLAYGKWSQSRSLIGTDLNKDAAPAFTLTNYDGRQMSLADFRGKPVVITFLYTHCPDVCPVIAEKLRAAIDQVGEERDRFAILAITTDPAHDDRLSIERFSDQHRMSGRWNYLIGSPSQLEPVWKSYYVAAQPIPTTDGSPVGGSLHTPAVFLIDKQGRERVYLNGGDFDPRGLVHDLRLLLSE